MKDTMQGDIIIPHVGTFVSCSKWLCDHGCTFLAPHEQVIYKQWRGPNGVLFGFEPNGYVRYDAHKTCPCLWNDIYGCSETHGNMLKHLGQQGYDKWVAEALSNRGSR